MTRVLSGLLLGIIFAAAIWFLPSHVLLLIAELVLIIGFAELATLLDRIGVKIPRLVSGVASCATCAAMARPGVPVELVLMAAVFVLALIALAAGPAPAALPQIAASLFPSLYLGLPLGALVAVHWSLGREAVLLLVATIVASDTSQYYVGRLLGRRLLAPAISPKKTVAGAVGGLIGGAIVMPVVGRWWMPYVEWPSLLAVAGVVVAFGMAGDLFESLIKRSADAKDSSALIPGHGGVLDRIDALLFAAPPFYVFARYLT